MRLLQLPAAPYGRVRVPGRTLDLRRHAPYIRLTHQEHFDVVHGHLYTYLRFVRAKVHVAHFHSDLLHRGSDGLKPGLSAADFDLIARHTHAQVVVSDFVAERLRQGLSAAGRVFVVPNGVEAARFEPTRCAAAGLARRTAWGIPPGAVLFLYAGAVVPEKGVLHLARAFAAVSKQHPDLHLALVGSSALWGNNLAGDPRETYQRAVQAALEPARQAGRAHLPGKVGTAEMPGLYAAADAVVLPSHWQEPATLVLLEAFAAGRPVVATATGGTPEVVGEGTGLLVPPGDEAALGRTLLELAGQPRCAPRSAAAPGSLPARSRGAASPRGSRPSTPKRSGVADAVCAADRAVPHGAGSARGSYLRSNGHAPDLAR